MSNSENPTPSASGELLSTFMDGEMDAPAAAFFARRLSREAELQATWSRWHMVRGYLRDGEADLASADGLDLAARVRAALEAEEAPQRQIQDAATPSNSWMQRFSRPLASAAIAATVAMTAIVGVNYYQGRDAAVDMIIASNPSTGPGEIPGPVRPGAASVVDLPLVPVGLNDGPSPQQSQDPLARARLEAYLLRHYWHTSANGRPVFVANVPAMGEQTAQNAQAQQDEDRAQATQTGEPSGKR